MVRQLLAEGTDYAVMSSSKVRTVEDTPDGGADEGWEGMQLKVKVRNCLEQVVPAPQWQDYSYDWYYWCCLYYYWGSVGEVVRGPLWWLSSVQVAFEVVVVWKEGSGVEPREEVVLGAAKGALVEVWVHLIQRSVVTVTEEGSSLVWGCVVVMGEE